MTTAELLEKLEYSTSPNFFSATEGGFDDAADFAHVFRRAASQLGMQGVYTLRQGVDGARVCVIPVVYVCEVQNEAAAIRIHRQVWNQNVVPFVITVSQDAIRLYSGFRFEREGSQSARGLLRVAKEMSEAIQLLDAFRSAKIDDGTIWERWSEHVTPETRVDWKLLSHLSDLDEWLRNNGVSDPKVSHGLVGKFVYLRYLRDRDILSAKRLDGWNLNATDIFSRHATLTAFWRLVDEVDGWLNGSVFPIPRTGPNSPRAEHIKKVAGVFSGDEPSGQLSLDFEVYDFSFIPIETLSVIYEQFLHAPVPKTGGRRGGSQTKGKELGAYYTPIPVVNFMLEELDTLHPFENGMTVLDPACGSGAFLVQTYRRIIEQDEEFDPNSTMRPARLRELLEIHIFGIDRDHDACRVAELSLLLTLLDYVDPPDLTRYSTFKLPDLHGSNIFEGDFFDPDAEWREKLRGRVFDWIVGNPPWVELKEGKITDDDRHAWAWLQNKTNKKERPTGGNQVAEAFAWEVLNWCDEAGHIALLLPAMTLFKDESKAFRAQMLSQHRFDCVANFANFSDVLFPGHRYRGGTLQQTKRPTRPAAAVFYGVPPDDDSAFPVYSPFVADQAAGRSHQPNRRKDTWSITPDASRIAYLDAAQVADGDALHWKAAMWGTQHDVRFLRRIAKEYNGSNLVDVCRQNRLAVAEGFQLRSKSSSDSVEAMPELTGQLQLDMGRLKNCGRIFAFPDNALVQIRHDEANLRKRGGRKGLEVSKPPHVIIDEKRRFAVYEDRFVAVPPRQIGIAGTADQSALLKAISLFLTSDFATYHQFFCTPQWGVSTSISTLSALKKLPVPLGGLSPSELDEWEQLHTSLRGCDPKANTEATLFDKPSHLRALISELNNRVCDLLKLARHERYLVSDLVHLRMQLTRGKVTADVIRDPTKGELEAYCRVLRDELDAFVDDQDNLRHKLTVSKDGRSAVVGIELLTNATRKQPFQIIDADAEAGAEFSKIRKRVRKKHSQWFYFNRNLRMYEGQSTFLFKPLSRLHWTESQALQDASTVIAETLE